MCVCVCACVCTHVCVCVVCVHVCVSPLSTLYSDRFNLFKRKKGGSDGKKGLKASTSLTVAQESSLVTSCSVPPSLKYSIGGGAKRVSHDHSLLSKSNIESTRDLEGEGQCVCGG